MNASDIFGVKKASYVGKSATLLIIDDPYYDPDIPAEWYDDPADQMAVFMGHPPAPEAGYTIPEGANPLGNYLTWEQRYRPKHETWTKWEPIKATV